MWSACVDVDEDAEDDGLQEGEGDDAFSYEGRYDVICGCEVFLD